MKKNGFGLIESIVSVVIISILFVPLLNALYSNLNLLIDAVDSKNAADISVNIIENLKNSADYTTIHQNLTYHYERENAGFYDTVTITVYRKNQAGDTLPEIVSSNQYLLK